ncbi:MAG: efflux RND transporter permease subunit [Phycisphaerales bacterium]|nr:efflux RND transporter permease subunit [Phycisphaerales bacterium]
MSLSSFSTSHWKAILFIVLALCLAGVYAAWNMPSSVFPQTNFPRVTILLDNGEMPADEMMATITRPVEEAMKDVPGVVNIRSSTGRGSSVVNVFFNWHVDMEQSELHVRSRLAQVRSNLPQSVDASAYRMTFSVFPIIGISLTSDKRSLPELTVAAEDAIKPRFLRIPGVARVDLVGSREPEYHIVADPLRLAANHLDLTQVVDVLGKSNLVAAGGLHEERDTLFLTLVDGRLHDIADIENLVVAMQEDHPVRIRDFARVMKAAEPAATVVTADGKESVLIMVRSQPDGSTLDIAAALKNEIKALHKEIPADMKLAFWYDQSLLVRDSVKSVWEAIIFGLILSVVILFAFLKDWGSTLVAIVVIPVTLLVTIVAMRLLHMTFNLMTLGGIAAAIGLVIDDAIVVVEAIHTKIATGMPRLEAVHKAIAEIFLPLTGSTLTPVVVFLPLAFLEGVPGVFFRALAFTMTVSLLTSLVLAVSLTPSLASLIIRVKRKDQSRDRKGATGSDPHGRSLTVAALNDADTAGFILRPVTRVYEAAVRLALKHRFMTIGICILLVLAGIDLYANLQSEFLPKLEERGFILDYVVKPAGTSLAESNRTLIEIEKLLRQIPEVESYSRRLGTAIGLELTEPNVGDIMVKLKPNSKRSTEEVITELREKLKHLEPQVDPDLHGMLADLIGDLTWSPKPVEIKIFSPDLEFLKQTAPAIENQIKEVPHVADTNDGLTIAGPALTFHVRSADAQRYGLTTTEIAAAVETAKLGKLASYVLQADRITRIRVLMDPKAIGRIETLKNVLLKTAGGSTICLAQVADVVEEPGQLELQREDLRQYLAVTGELEGGDLGSVIRDIQSKLAGDPRFPPGSIEFGGLYKQQQDSFHNLILVMMMALLLIFTVLVLEFRSFLQPIAILAGAMLALIGTVAALYLTNTSENIISHLGAIIGIGIVAKNGILMLDYVDHLRNTGLSIEDALIQSGRRRLRPVLMTSLAAALGMLPLAYGIGSGADMLRPLAIAVIGALTLSVLLSLLATPTVFYLLYKFTAKQPSSRP